MKKLFFKLFLVFFPLLLIFLLYFIFDPFKVLYTYENYYESTPPHIVLNRDFVSLNTFIKNYPKYKYDSFIFGNSRTLTFRVKTWKKFINKSSCFHFDAFGESLYGIYAKFKYLNLKNIKIANALIVLDSSHMLQKVNNSSGRLYLKHPELSGQNKFFFHFENFRDFLSLEFLLLFWDFTIMGHEIPKLSLVPQDPYDLPANEIRWDFVESVIAANPEQYYTKEKIQTFFKRDNLEKYSPKTINSEQIKTLIEIKKILILNKTNYKIIISPVYDQIKFNKDDLNKLYEIFGKENVFDFSGVNAITENYLNFYDSRSHYRPHVADFILEKIYKN